MGEPVQSRDRPTLATALPERIEHESGKHIHTIGSGATEAGPCSVRPRERSTLKGGNHVKSDLRFLLLPVRGVALSGAEFCCLRRRQRRGRRRGGRGGGQKVPRSD